MASLRAKRGFLFIDFRWQGVRCRESTKREDTPANRAELRRLARQIDGEIAAGTFIYARFFPEGPKRDLFALPPPGRSADSPLPFDGWARGWIKTRESRLDASTYYDRVRMIEGPIIGFFGSRQVSTIDSEDVEEFIAHIKKRAGARKPPEGEAPKPLSNRRANMILQVLRLCLDPAVKKGWLRSNPAREVKRLREEKTRIDPLSLEEVRAFLSTGLRDDEERRYFRVAFFSGLRPSEEIGLQWPNLDWHNKPPLIGVYIGITRRGGEHVPKTDSSYREVQMVPVVEQALRGQRAASELRSKFVFANERGGSLDITNIRERVWKPGLRRAGLRYRTMYQTRHTFATLALASGEDIGWVAKQLGHTTTEMVIRHYHKFIPNLTRRDGSALARLIQGEGL
jgi:integrase